MAEPARASRPCADVKESMKKTAAIYTRVAVEDQKNDTALKELRAILQAHGLEHY